MPQALLFPDLEYQPLMGSNNRYDAILADPPWRFQAGGDKCASSHYACMSLADICALPVAEQAKDSCLLFMWATQAMLPQAFDVIKAWEFEYVSFLVWSKRTPTGLPAFGTAYWLRSSAEPLIFAKRGKPKVQIRNQRNYFEAPVREHSRKPDCVYDIVERMTGGTDYLELFSRQTRQGWDCWGNETNKFGHSSA